ncbi:MAG: PIN domain-containing protein [Chloroflexia bacterium]|nr:PIN domain-containing protein [Chloroflexia bacterium]
MVDSDIVLDACVLIPMALCDVLLRAAAANLYRPRWSEDILVEVGRNLVENGLTDDRGAQHRISAMRQAFADASVEIDRNLLGGIDVDPKDRHVVAAAIAGNAQTIVTLNLRHFPEHALSPYGIEAQSPDGFLVGLCDFAPSAMIDVVRRQAADLRNPPVSLGQLLDSLSRHAPSFADRMRSHPP